MSPDTRRHRGAHPSDARLFAAESLPVLRAATADFAWLLTRGYAPVAALKLVGDRYQLRARQREALARAACSDDNARARQAACLPLAAIAGDDVVIDGFNLLITLESALSGGVVVRCRDGCLRDLAGIHGTYRSVAETLTAIRLVGEALCAYQPRCVEWLLDRPVSNSGRLAQRIRAEAAIAGWPWTVNVVVNPDAVMMTAGRILVTSDSVVLDHAVRWVNLSAGIVAQRVPHAWIIDLGDDFGKNSSRMARTPLPHDDDE
jgi:hypothetical protein